jgi:hypothetical protein
MNYQAAYELAERENSNLRRHIKFCIQHMPTERLQDLSALMKPSIESGGSVGDTSEDEEREYVQIRKLLGRIVGLVEQIIPPDGSPHSIPDDLWFSRMDALMNLAREHEDKEQPVRLSDIRDMAG